MRTGEQPSLRHLRMFEAVARLESLSRAAVEVNRTQPAVTQALANLEEILEATLIDRRHSGSYLTELGRILHLRVQRLLAQLDAALEEPLVGLPFAERSRLKQMQGKITSTHVRSLVAAAEGGSVEQAAHLVGVSPASLLRSVRELECILGRRLTHHSAGGVTTTSAGAELARRLKLAMREIDHAREEINAARGRIETLIAVGAIPQCATLLLARAVDEFLRCNPNAQVKISDGPYDALLGDLRAGRIDFLFGVLRKPDWAVDVHEEPLFADPYAIVARRDHPLTRKRKVRLEDLAAYDWIVPRPGTPRRVSFERLFAQASRRPTASVETSALDMQVALIETSDRMTLMSWKEAQRTAASGEIIALDYHPGVARSRDGVATRAGWQPTAGQLRFLDILRKQTGRAPLSGPAKASASVARLQPPARRRTGALAHHSG